MSYLPATDGGLNDWASNFQQKTSAVADPTTIGLTAGEVSAYSSVFEVYTFAYAAAIDPATRGEATILAKNEAKKTLVALSRQLAMAVTNHAGITNSQRQAFGLTVRSDGRTPVPPPSTSPALDIESVQGWTVNIRLHNTEVSGRSKPLGVTGAFVYTYVGETAPTDITAWHMEGTTSRTISKVVFPGSLEPGTKVWITAAWVNPTLQTGPACTPRSTQINFGGLSGGNSSLQLAA